MENFTRRVRIRACGLLTLGDTILLVKHAPFGPAGHLWIPPGGGVEYGETIEEALKREFMEETGLAITPGHLMIVHEYLKDDLHAVELFFMVEQRGGQLQKGQDPELPESKQLIQEVRFYPYAEMTKEGMEYFHQIFQQLDVAQEIQGKATSPKWLITAKK